MDKEYKIIREFKVKGNTLYVVIVNGNAHVLDDEELSILAGSSEQKKSA